MTWRIVLLAVALLAPQAEREAEIRKVQEILGKQRRGELVTAEEREFVKQVNARRAAEFRKGNPPREFTGLVPLPDLGKGSYQGETGGLYPGGENQPPRAHLEAGLEAARRIRPLNREGQPAGDGKIVLLSVGMSNTTQEFREFQKLAAGEAGLHPALVLVDGAQGGRAADTTADPQAGYWKVAAQRLAEAGVTEKQVQVAWLKQAIIQPRAPFPAEVRRLEGYLAETIRNLAARYPNLRIVYLSSRIYGGYAETPLNPEPHAYESGFAVRRVIAAQIAGEGPRSPWLGWGPYLWADGVKGRQDGLTWTREDLAPDGTHPSMAGRGKVARFLLEFLRRDPTARSWFLPRP
jgi:lysophospholipase L1-like esterase